MHKANKYIGFDDRWVLLLLIPILSFIIPIIFFERKFDDTPYYTKEVYITTFITTLVVWVGNRYIAIWCRRHYQNFNLTKRRLYIQSGLMFLFTIIATNSIHILLEDYCGLITNKRNEAYMLIKGNAAALICTLAVIAIYEGIYFRKQLRIAIEETESLKRENLNAQLNALKTQVNPHFLFNNLNTLTSLIPENPNHAVDFVQQLSKVYRHILEVRNEKSICLRDELEVIEAYSFLLKTRFENNLIIDIDIPADKMHKKIVPLSLQLLIENAIKHNIASTDKPLRISIFSNNGSLVVNNNLQVKNQIHESTGIGLENIQNRYKLLTSKPVSITMNEKKFSVSIPLLEN